METLYNQKYNINSFWSTVMVIMAHGENLQPALTQQFLQLSSEFYHVIEPSDLLSLKTVALKAKY